MWRDIAEPATGSLAEQSQVIATIGRYIHRMADPEVDPAATNGPGPVTTIFALLPDVDFDRFVSRLGAIGLVRQPESLADQMVAGLSDLNEYAVRNTSIYLLALGQAIAARRIPNNPDALTQVAKDLLWDDNSPEAIEKIKARLDRALATSVIRVGGEASAIFAGRGNMVAGLNILTSTSPIVVDKTVQSFVTTHALVLDVSRSGNANDIERVEYMMDRSDLEKLRAAIDDAVAAEDLLDQALDNRDTPVWKPWVDADWKS